MLQGKQVVTFNTRLVAKGPQKKTRMTVDWTGVTDEILRAYTLQALVVRVQGGFRTKKAVPDEFSIVVKDHAPGTRSVGMTEEEAISLVMSDPAKRAELFKKYGIADTAAKKAA